MNYQAMMDDVKHYAKYAGLWLTTRGITSLAVLAATMGFGVSGYAIPLITMPIGLGAATYLTMDRSNYLKTRIKNAYKLEIAATLGKDPQSVTVDDLTRVAEGDRYADLKGNAILREQLDRIDDHRTLSLVSTAIAVGIAALAFFAIIGGGFTGIFDTAKTFLEPVLDNPLIRNKDIFAAGLLASSITFSADHLFQYLGESAMGLRDRSSYEIIHDLKRQQRDGVNLSPQQVLEVFISRDPLLKQHIINSYGVPYADLPTPLQTEVLNGLDQRDLIVKVTEKINDGRVSPNELAFLAEAQHSGLPERTTNQSRYQQAEMLSALKPIAKQVNETIQRVGDSISDAKEAVGRATANLDAGDFVPNISFVDKYLQSSHAARTPSNSYAEQVRQEAALSAGIEKS